MCSWSRTAGACALTTLLAACADGPHGAPDFPGVGGDRPGGDDPAATVPPDLVGDRPDGGGATDSDAPADPATAPTCARFDAPEQVATVQDAALEEISGVVVSVANDGILWTLEDSGNAPVLTALDASGATRGTITLEGVRAVDWEGLGIGPCAQGTCLVVGDVGDNALARDTVQVLRVPEPAVGAEPFALTAVPEVVTARYPGGTAHNVEGVTVTPGGDAWMVTKRVDGTADVFALRDWDTTRTVEMEVVATLDVGAAAATAADLSADGRTLFVRTYTALWTYPVVDGVPGAPTEVEAATEPQGEAVAWDPIRRGFWQISEWANPPMWFGACGE